MRRRDFLAGVVFTAAVQGAVAQQSGKIYRVAVVEPATPVGDLSKTRDPEPVVRAFFDELRNLGYVEGKNILVELRSGEGKGEYYPELARDVVNHRPDAIFAYGNQMAVVFKAATSTIPIVAGAVDPVASGLVHSLSRPGGNITGVSPYFDISIWTKRLELLREVVPSAKQVALLASHYFLG